MTKTVKTYRANDLILNRLRDLQNWLGLNEAEVIETSINQFYETERIKGMNIQALTETVARAIAKMEADGISGWGLSNPDEELFEQAEISGPSGCTTSNCAHNSHDPAAPTIKLIPRKGDKIIALGSESESDGYTDWYAIIGDSNPRVFKLNDRQAFHAQLWEKDIADVPEWMLAKLAKN